MLSNPPICNRGFSLIEAMISLGLIGLIALAITESFRATTQKLNQQRTKLQAQQFATKVQQIFESSRHCTVSLQNDPVVFDIKKRHAINQLSYGRFSPTASNYLEAIPDLQLPSAPIADSSALNEGFFVNDVYWVLTSALPEDPQENIYGAKVHITVESSFTHAQKTLHPLKVQLQIDSTTQTITNCIGLDKGIMVVEIPTIQHTQTPTTVPTTPVSQTSPAAPEQITDLALKIATCEIDSNGLYTYSDIVGKCIPRYKYETYDGTVDRASCPAGLVPFAENPDTDGRFGGHDSWQVCTRGGDLDVSVTLEEDDFTTIKGSQVEAQLVKWIPHFRNRDCECHYADEVLNKNQSVCRIRCYNPNSPVEGGVL